MGNSGFQWCERTYRNPRHCQEYSLPQSMSAIWEFAGFAEQHKNDMYYDAINTLQRSPDVWYVNLSGYSWDEVEAIRTSVYAGRWESMNMPSHLCCHGAWTNSALKKIASKLVEWRTHGDVRVYIGERGNPHFRFDHELMLNAVKTAANVS